MGALDRKLYRDLGRLWAQVLAIAMVMACGVATLILAVGAYRSLEETRSAFYERYRFGTVFAGAVRAPETLRSRIEAISGVSTAELRIVRPILLDVEGMSEPASGTVVSMPDFTEPGVNRLYLRQGRMPEPGRSDEVAVVETFADAHGFRPGDRVGAIMNGTKRDLTIVGIVLSPEFIYSIGPGDIVPDPRRFGVFFMPATTLAGLFDMEGSFNDLALTTMRDADTDRVIEKLDRLLKPYGGKGAYDRADQTSNAFLDAELTQLRGMARIIPPIFLFVSAFLVNMILSRLVALEREQVGLLKAVGYGNFAIGWHYAKLVIAIALVGLLVGSAAGYWLGLGLTRLYATFFSFPFLIFKQSADLYLLAGGVTVAAALAGAAKSIWSIVNLPPAVAMRPPAPSTYRHFLGDWFKQFRLFSQLTIMAIRHLVRYPVRSTLTVFGTSLSVALLVTALFSQDSIDFMIDTMFFRSDRQDATITFSSERHGDAISTVAALPGVVRAEPFRSTPVKLRNGLRELRMTIVALPSQGVLSRVLDLDLEPMQLPSRGLVLSERVAAKLKLRPGDPIEIELLERANRIERVELAAFASNVPGSDNLPLRVKEGVTGIPVAAVSQSFVGLTAYMNLDALDRLMRDGRRISGARLLIDSARIEDIYDAVKRTPAIASIALQDKSREKFRETIEQNITTMTAVYVGLAIIITFGVIYNSARIQLSERARELASLRVFGFTRAEVSSVLLMELGLIVVLAQPLGWLGGYAFAWSVVEGAASDLFRIPLIISASTFAWASLVVVGSAVVSALVVRRRVDALDLIRVLKTRE